MSFRNVLLGYVFNQFLLYFIRRVGRLWHKAESVADAEHVCVYSHGGLSECDRLYDVGCLSAYTGQGEKLVKSGGNHAAVPFHQCLCHLCKMPCLCARIPPQPCVLKRNMTAERSPSGIADIFHALSGSASAR